MTLPPDLRANVPHSQDTSLSTAARVYEVMRLEGLAWDIGAVKPADVHLVTEAYLSRGTRNVLYQNGIEGFPLIVVANPESFQKMGTIWTETHDITMSEIEWRFDFSVFTGGASRYKNRVTIHRDHPPAITLPEDTLFLGEHHTDANVLVLFWRENEQVFEPHVVILPSRYAEAFENGGLKHHGQHGKETQRGGQSTTVFEYRDSQPLVSVEEARTNIDADPVGFLQTLQQRVATYPKAPFVIAGEQARGANIGKDRPDVCIGGIAGDAIEFHIGPIALRYFDMTPTDIRLAEPGKERGRLVLKLSVVDGRLMIGSAVEVFDESKHAYVKPTSDRVTAHAFELKDRLIEFLAQMKPGFAERSGEVKGAGARKYHRHRHPQPHNPKQRQR